MTNTEDPLEILLVEDDPEDVRLLREAFGELSIDVMLTVISDGADAVDRLEDRCDDAAKTVPDLVLLDLGLPGMDGFEFLETIRNDGVLARLPVLVLTRSRATEDVLESYDLAANAYLTKPTDPSDYASIVEAIAEFWFRQAMLPSSSP
ncbi:response regulator [Natronobacterium texcoconense]|uniref:Response regulator receiver domain-containing protein n=1 Tax=Natronobacterium texcoconense TaxID=1095778 RepID=A0A1H1FC55_NATTX|nr:response regulator [Natronobacterium texcoconense]SDQ98309.1 Response regulator receiver domain-containing protein [Natronobacterium texcoconense]